MVSIDSDAPMKNIVNVRKRLAMPDMMVPTCGTLSRTNVFRSIHSEAKSDDRILQEHL